MLIPLVTLFLLYVSFICSQVHSTASLEAPCLPACLPASLPVLCQIVWVCDCVCVFANRKVDVLVVGAPRPETTYSPMRRSAEMQGARSLALRLLPLICCICAAAGYPFKTPLDLDVTPRVTVLRSGEHGHTCARTVFLFRTRTKVY